MQHWVDESLRRVATLWSPELITLAAMSVSEPAENDVLKPTMEALVDQMALLHLGITDQAFRSRWYAREYQLDVREQVRALDHLMRTGQWLPGALA
jgi:hypothetical protein